SYERHSAGPAPPATLCSRQPPASTAACPASEGPQLPQSYSNTGSSPVRIGFHDTPRGLNTGFASKQRAVTAQRVADEPLIWLHLFARTAALDQAHILADHRLTWHLGLCLQCDEYIRTQAEGKLIT